MPALTPARPVGGFCVQRGVARRGIRLSLLAHRLARPATSCVCKGLVRSSVLPDGVRVRLGVFWPCPYANGDGLARQTGEALPVGVVCMSGRVKGRVMRQPALFLPAPEAGRRCGTVGGCFPSGRLPANHKAAQQRQTKVFPHRLRGVPRPTMRAVDLASLAGTPPRFSNLGCRASKGNRTLPLGN